MTTTVTSDRMRVYVAAPYKMSSVVRAFHRELRENSFDVTSGWAETPAAVDGVPENLPSMSRAQIDDIAADNDEGVHAAHAVVALCYPGLGKEMFCECALARLLEKKIVWVSMTGDLRSLPLSAFRRGSVRAEDLERAMLALSSIRIEAGRQVGWRW